MSNSTQTRASPVHLHLRAETKTAEHRSALTPTTTAALLKAGFKVSVERSDQRIFDDQEFQSVGAEIVEFDSWRNAPLSTYIIGLKELPENDTSPLPHDHIMFAHCYKNQAGWENVLARWSQGGGTLLDLEFLTDATGRRVAAFGYHAGFAGAALALQVWAWQKQTGGDGSDYPEVKPYPNETALLKEVNGQLEAAVKLNGGSWPRIIVIGALGRCGSGAVDAALKAGVPDANVLKWDMAETASGGPFPEILESDIFVNCIYLSKAGPMFVTYKDIENHVERQLSVIADVSCDTTNPHNPIPIYSINTTFAHPVVNVETPEGSKPLSVISIDHLPTMLPRESSESFSSALLPSLLELQNRENARVWTDAEKLFKEKVATLPGSL